MSSKANGEMRSRKKAPENGSAGDSKTNGSHSAKSDLPPFAASCKIDSNGDPIPDFSTLPFVMRHRWIFVFIFLFPLSLLFDLFTLVRGWLHTPTPQSHNARVQRIQSQIQTWDAKGRKGRLCTDRPGWMSMSLRPNAYKDSLNKIKALDLCDVLSIDTERRIVRCEPFVSVAQLTAHLLPRGYTVPVIPELDDLTVGGLLFGVGIESSSHKYGLFNDLCVSYDVVLATGELVHVTADNEHKELFYALPWSYGTLGFLVAAELRIIPCKKYVHLKYYPCHTQQQGVDTFSKFSTAEKCPTFVEGIAFSPSRSVVMTGEFADEKDRAAVNGTVNRIALWFKPWFYEHVRSFLSSSTKADDGCVHSEFIPLREYYHRHTRSIFWQMREIVSFGNHPVFRWLLGWLLPPKIAVLKLTTPQSLSKVYESRFVFQDMLVPLDQLGPSLECFRDEFYLYPLWLCPHRLYRTNPQGFLPTVSSALKPGQFEMFVDIGAYGMPAPADFDAPGALRRVEQFVRDVKGFQMLYADTYMNEEEFRVMFNHSLWEKMRKQYKAEGAFPSIFEKVRKQ